MAMSGKSTPTGSRARAFPVVSGLSRTAIRKRKVFITGSAAQYTEIIGLLGSPSVPVPSGGRREDAG
jgi:hypothetical protein